MVDKNQNKDQSKDSSKDSKSVASKSDTSLNLSKDTLYSIVIVLLVGLLVVSVFTHGFTTQKNVDNQSDTQCSLNSGIVIQGIPETELTAKVGAYINQNLLSQPYYAEVTGVTHYNDYIDLVNLNIMQDTTVLQATQVYASSDGALIFIGQVFKTNESLVSDTPVDTPPATTPDVVKADRPKAEAFIMAFCPYGLQFLKAYVPVMELFGDKADVEVQFVDYAMHGKTELDANNYLYCTQENNKEKFADYLRCFVTDGDYEGCVATTGFNATEIETCVLQLDTQYNITGLYNNSSTWVSGQYPMYPVDGDLNTLYGVQGSPTFVLNGEIVKVSRSAEAIKQAICASFNDPPAECQTTLRTDQESPGLGAVASGTGSGSASCE